MRIAVDAMGGDRAPGVLVEGAWLAMDEIGADVDILLVGREEALRSEIGAMSSSSRISIVEAPEVVGMGESALSALRKKRRSSIVTAMQLQKENQADAAISAGNTGAAVACSLVTLGRLPGVNRPAIASLFPTEHGQCIVLDVGANAECKPINLFQFGVMGSLYVSHMFGIEHPRVGLMSIGEERSKGNELVVQAHNLLAESSLHFIGNVEGRDVLLGTADVVICDGFVGNVLLKFTESVIHLLTASLREKALSSLRRKLGALLLKPAFEEMKREMNYEEYGGAPLLGIDGITIICHGSSSPKAIARAIRVAERMARERINESIKEQLQRISIAPEELRQTSEA